MLTYQPINVPRNNGMLKYIIISFFYILLITGLITAETAPHFSVSSCTSPSMVANEFKIPVDTTKSYCLSIEIPYIFKPLHSTKAFNEAQIRFIEFIQKNEDSSSWTELIAIHRIKEKGIVAESLSKHLLEKFQSTNRPTQLLQNNSFHLDTISGSLFILKYTHNNNQEIIGNIFYSGENDLAGVQYTIRLKDQNMLKKAEQKIEDFFSKQIRLIKNN